MRRGVEGGESERCFFLVEYRRFENFIDIYVFYIYYMDMFILDCIEFFN